jgi:hypothetical protein
MRGTLVSPGNVEYIWPSVKKYIHSAFEAGIGDDTEESVIRLLFRRDAQLWVAHDMAGVMAAAITRVCVVNNGRKICFCIACGGQDFPEWEHTIEDIEKWAKAQGCDAVRISGRLGWRAYRKRDYKQPFIILEKAL